MRNPLPVSAVLLLAATIGGCDTTPRPPTEQDKALQHAIEAPQDKARAVEQQLLEDQKRKREEIDEQGG